MIWRALLPPLRIITAGVQGQGGSLKADLLHYYQGISSLFTFPCIIHYPMAQT